MQPHMLEAPSNENDTNDLPVKEGAVGWLVQVVTDVVISLRMVKLLLMM